VYQLKQALSGRGTMPGNLPDLPVPDDMDPLRSEAAKVQET
jgi:hypothetical protein